MGGKKIYAPERCYHWCPVGKHDWAHIVKLSQASGRPDQYKKVCQDCAKGAKNGNHPQPRTV